MTVSLGSVLEFARFTIQRPQEAARAAMAAKLPMSARWLGLVLAAVLSALTVHLYLGLFPADQVETAGFGTISPFATVVLDLGFNLVVAYLVFAIGRWRGGRGSFADSLLLVVWLQLILILPQILQLVVAVLVPPLASIIGLLSVGLYFWLICHFIAALHGFTSIGRVFLGVVLTMVAAVFLLAFLMLPLIG